MFYSRYSYWNKAAPFLMRDLVHSGNVGQPLKRTLSAYVVSICSMLIRNWCRCGWVRLGHATFEPIMQNMLIWVATAVFFLFDLSVISEGLAECSRRFKNTLMHLRTTSVTTDRCHSKIVFSRTFLRDRSGSSWSHEACNHRIIQANLYIQRAMIVRNKSNLEFENTFYHGIWDQCPHWKGYHGLV